MDWSSFHRWQEILAEGFFGTDRAGKVVRFFVNDEVEAELHGGEEGLRRLGSATAAVLLWDEPAYLLVKQRVSEWRRTTRDGPPPCLPLLAASVLAATRMHSDEDIRKTNYYARLAEVLKPERDHGDVRAQLSRSYGEVVDMWHDLQRWLVRSNGGRGILNISAPPGRERIGYSMSQALACEADTELIRQFFHATGVDPRQPGPTDALLSRLSAWQSFGHLSRTLRNALINRSSDDLLEQLLLDLLGSWDGEPPRISVKRGNRIPMLIAAEEDEVDGGWQLSWRVGNDAAYGEETLNHYGGSIMVLNRSGSQGGASLSGDLPDIETALRNGFEARGNSSYITRRAGRHIVTLHQDRSLGWIEIGPRPEPRTRYLVLANEHGADAMRAAGFINEDTAAEPTTARGWSAFFGISAEVADLERLILAESKAAQRVRGRHDLAPVGGLKIATEVRNTYYLLGAEPDLKIGAAWEGERLFIDDQPVATADTELVRLRGLGLGEGRHTARIGDREVEIWLRAPIPAKPIHLKSNEPLGRIIAQFGWDSRFLLHSGRFIRCAPSSAPALGSHPAAPEWWSERGTGLTGQIGYEVEVPETSVWMVSRAPGKQGHRVRLLRSAAPQIGRLSRHEQAYWAELVIDLQDGTEHARLWKQYLEAVLKATVVARV